MPKGPKITKRDRFNPIDNEFCEKTKRAFPEFKSMTNSEMKTVIKKFNLFMVDTILTYRAGTELPAGLGQFLAGCFPSKDIAFKQKIRKQCEAIGIESIYNSEDQDGFDPRMFYITNRKSKTCKELKFYGFVPTTNIKDKIRRVFEKNWKNFVMITDVRFMSNLFNSPPKNKIRELPEDYNEFKFE